MATEGKKRDEEEELELPPNTKKELAAVDSALSSSIHVWMKRRNKSVRPKLNQEQQHQMKECFELMDQDGSGAIDADELGAAFKLLGIGLRKSEIEQILDDVGMNADGEVEYPQFLEIMTVTLQKLAEEQAEENGGNSTQVPFALMATAYRRKRLMEGIISGDKETMGQIVHLSEQQAQEAAMRDAAVIEETERKARNSNRRNGIREVSGEAPSQKATSSAAKRIAARLARMHVDEGLIEQMSGDERRMLTMVATKAQKEQAEKSFSSLARLPHDNQNLRSVRRSKSSSLPLPHPMSSPPPSTSRHMSPQQSQQHQKSARNLSTSRGSPRSSLLQPLATDRCWSPSAGLLQERYSVPSYQRHNDNRYSTPYQQSPRHQQLVGTPQCFDLKFAHVKSTGQSGGSHTHRSQSSGLPFPTVTRKYKSMC